MKLNLVNVCRVMTSTSLRGMANTVFVHVNIKNITQNKTLHIFTQQYDGIALVVKKC